MKFLISMRSNCSLHVDRQTLPSAKCMNFFFVTGNCLKKEIIFRATQQNASGKKEERVK